MSVHARAATATLAAAVAIVLGGGAATASAAALPPPSAAPQGGDWYFHYLAQRCERGSMQACDSLTIQTRLNTSDSRWVTYNRYGVTCGGRVDYTPYAPARQNCSRQFPDAP